MIKSMQGTPYHIIEGWMLKEKDEFEWETRIIKKNTDKSKIRKSNFKKFKNIKGDFTLKFDGEEPVKYIIGENISKDAEIINKICLVNSGDTLCINGEHVILLEKNIYIRI